MKKILLIFVGLMWGLSVSFGQDFFEVPLSPNHAEKTPAFVYNYVFDFKKARTRFNGNNESVVVEQYRQIESFNSGPSPISSLPEINYSEGSNMPIIDLSKGYSLNLPIKEFSKNFRSNMPITELKLPNLIILPQRDR